MKFRTQFNPDYTGATGEITTQKSQTTPDMSLTVIKLLENHSRNITSQVHHNEPLFFDTEIIQHDDIVDAMEHKQALLDSQADLEAIAEQEQAESAKIKKEAAKAAKIALKKQQDFEAFEKSKPDPTA